MLSPGDIVGYLGDYDLSGGQIKDNTRRVLERGELLIVTADNMALLRFVEDSGMFRRAGSPSNARVS
jgi:hypothetical protein